MHFSGLFGFLGLVLGFREGLNFASEDERGGFEEKAGGRRPLSCMSECSNDGEGDTYDTRAFAWPPGRVPSPAAPFP